jgi:hypothetical protein
MHTDTGKKILEITFPETYIHNIINEWGNETFFKGDDLDKDNLRDCISWLYSSGGGNMPQVFLLDSPLACQMELNRIDKNGLHSLCAYQADINAWDKIKSHMYSLAFTDVWCASLPIFKTADNMQRLNALENLILWHINKIAIDDRKFRFYPFSDDNLLHRFSKIAFYDFLHGYISDEYGKAHSSFSKYFLTSTGIQHLKRYIKFLKSGCFLSLLFRGLALISRRPKHIKFNSSHRLHCEGSAAIEWRDGWKLFYLNGVLVPEEVAVTPAGSLDPSHVMRERNVEVRREIVRKIGVERILQKLGGKIIDSWNGYELIALNIPDMHIKPVYLKMQNPSIGTYHLEGVPPKITTCKDALSWRVGGLKWNPKQLT